MANNTSSVGYKNPYSDRGYRYDTETGLYYLQSRYYNPEHLPDEDVNKWNEIDGIILVKSKW